MASSAAVKVACVVVMCMVLVAAPPKAEAGITCGQVTTYVAPCISYFQKGGAQLPRCCAGIRSLNTAAKTTPDRQAACSCLKAGSKSLSKSNITAAAALPGKCGVAIPYKISPDTDCSKVK